MNNNGENRRHILLNCQLPETVRKVFHEHFSVSESESLSEALVKNESLSAVVVSIESEVGPATVSQLSDGIKAIATYSVGTDHIDVSALARRGIPVLNTPDVLSRSVAEATVFLVLALARRATESIDLVRSGNWQGWTPSQLIGFEVHNATIGIIGMGSIGRKIADLLAAFGANIVYHNRRPVDGTTARHCTTTQELYGLADIVILACPATPETERMINRDAIRQMKQGAYVVNIARGTLIDDDALIEALQGGRLSGAALDVFDGEPNFDRRYLTLPTVFMTPHIGSSTIQARISMAEKLRDGLLTLFAGGTPDNLVRP